MSEDMGYHLWEEVGLLLEFREQRPGMLLNVLRRTGQPPAKNDTIQNVNSTQLRNSHPPLFWHSLKIKSVLEKTQNTLVRD